MTVNRQLEEVQKELRAREIPQEALESAALRQNLQETSVAQLHIDPKYEVLIEAVEGYRGIQKAAEALLFELHHPFKNWEIILRELRSFALKYFSAYSRHPRGPKAIAAIIDVFFEAINQVASDSLEIKAIDYLLNYLEKIVSELSGQNHDEIWPILRRTCERLGSLPEKQFFYLASCHIPLKKIGQTLLLKLPEDSFLPEFNHLLIRSLKVTYAYWLKEEDPLGWYDQGGTSLNSGEKLPYPPVLISVSHARFKSLLQELEDFTAKEEYQKNGYWQMLHHLLTFPSYLEIVGAYKEIPLLWPPPQVGEKEIPLLENKKILALFKIMEIPGLKDIHEETLREINHTLVELIRKEPPERMRDFLIKTFSLFKSSMEKYPHTALQCIQTLGTEIFNQGYSPLVEVFLELVLHFGFQYPNVQGVDTNWQLISNPCHLLNVRVWLDIIGRNPKWCSTLLSALIINLKLAGICIRDTDLFQKEISKLLNAEIEPVYNLIKQLAKLFPVYFNEIGAEGELREATTEIDEITNRKDALIHFLRKQSHVESSNLIEDFVREILRFWRLRDKGGIKNFLPGEIWEKIETTGPYIDEVNYILQKIFEEKRLQSEKDLLGLTDHELSAFMNSLTGVAETEKRRVFLLIKIYRLINQKYNLGFPEIAAHLQEASRWGFESLDSLLQVIKRNNPEECLEHILDHLDNLKKIILSPQKFEAREDIYRKRHIAADIPSMYGRYRERKFDALGLTFRLENLANIYFEKLIDSLDLSFITRATFFKIIICLRYLIRAIELDGIFSPRLNTQLMLLEKSLEIKRFTFMQYLDIFRGFSEGVKDVISVYYVNAHKNNLDPLIWQMGAQNILSKYLPAGAEEIGPQEFVHQIAERFTRDLIANTFGLQYLDNLLARIQQTLAEQKETLNEADLDLLMTYDPKKVCCLIHHPHRLTNDLIHLGSKGYNLVVLAAEGIPVPPGFILTTEVFRCLRIIERYKHAHDQLEREIRLGLQQIEKATGREFGNPERPLLLAVRSGSTISMPGMMATLLNVGINEEIVEGLIRSTGESWFAWDNYRRFIQSWGMSYGIEREVFNEVMRHFKAKYKVEKKRQFSGEEMKELALTYRRAVEERHITIYEDPWAQLQVAIKQVLSSWNSIKARQYREIMGISDYWGTAVIVQAMVFGNLSLSSGSGVVFTAHPYRKIRRVALWGDFTPGNQGEDIVGGLVSTYPISKEQKELEGREEDLEEAFPKIYKRLFEIAKTLIYEKKWNPQEVEFTFESPEETSLYILQTRDMVSTKREKFEVFTPSPSLQENFLSKGIGVSGGALSGRVVFNLEEIQHWRRLEPETPLIFVRSDTVPEDIQEISLADGLLTAKGGQTSHAAIVAFELAKTAVVGCRGLVVLENERRLFINHVEIKGGDFLSLDGRKGLVYLGKHEIKAEENLPTFLV
ncbi:MAG: PEP/pyruvate-binding domain-containing protein [Thermodesulfobacteriota bacterium]